MKTIILTILILILIILLTKLSNNNEYFGSFKNYNCPEVEKIKDKYYETSVDIDTGICTDKPVIAEYDDYSAIDLKKIKNKSSPVENYRLTNINGPDFMIMKDMDLENNRVKLTRFKTYFDLPGYKSFTDLDNTGDLKYFEKNYGITIEDKRIVSQGYNYKFD